MPTTTTSTTQVHKEYLYNVEKWKTVRDCVAGAKTVKENGVLYLPKPNAADTSEENRVRYLQYLARAQYVNFTGRSERGFVGLVRRKEPIVDLPSGLDYLNESATSTGVGIDQLADDTVSELLETGRYGMLADFPEMGEGLTAAEVSALNPMAKILTYKAENIVDWHESVVAGQRIVDFVKLAEVVDSMTSGSATYTTETQYRVLRLVNLVPDDIEGGDSSEKVIYRQEVYKNGSSTEPTEVFEPKKADGSYFTEIPFVFVGSESNDPAVDPAPLYDIADINVGHYRNSADYEESVFITGQPTLFISSDMSSDQFANANPNGIQIGARRGHFLGSNGSAIMLQAEPNTLAKEAMDLKERQLMMVGAKIIEPQSRGANETAEGARIRYGAENSTLSKIVDNTSDAIMAMIGYIGEFTGIDVSSAVYKLNTQFYDPGTDPQAIMATIALFDRQVIGMTDMRNFSRKQGVIESDRTDQEVENDVNESDL